MRPPAPIWQINYAHDRRQHRHRCIQCNRIVNAEEAVFMAKVVGKKTKICHVGYCAETTADGMTAYDRLRSWGLEYLKTIGWSARTIDALNLALVTPTEA